MPETRVQRRSALARATRRVALWVGVALLVVAVVLPPVGVVLARTPVGHHTGQRLDQWWNEHGWQAPVAPASVDPSAEAVVLAPSSGGVINPAVTVQCGVQVQPPTPEQVQALGWLQLNLSARSVVLSGTQFYASWCALTRPANLALAYQPSLGADPAVWPVDVVVSTAQLRAEVDPQALERLPLLASFGSSEHPDTLVQVRQRRPLPSRAAVSASLLQVPGVQVSPSAQAVLDQVGIDPRLVQVLRGFVHASAATSSDGHRVRVLVGDFPLSSGQDFLLAPRRVAVIDAFDGQPGSSALFDTQAGYLQQYLASLSDDQRPSSSGVVVTAAGRHQFQLSFLLPVGS